MDTSNISSVWGFSLQCGHDLSVMDRHTDGTPDIGLFAVLQCGHDLSVMDRLPLRTAAALPGYGFNVAMTFQSWIVCRSRKCMATNATLQCGHDLSVMDSFQGC